MAYSTITKPSLYFNTKLYTGTGTSHNITGVGFQPDWVWVKNRDISTDAPTIYDAVRGATKRLQTSSTGAESTKTNGLTAFGSDGYTAGSASAINANGSNLVSWNWLGANGTASNSNGSITSSVSANTTAGFSIVSYTGTGSNATVGHGLGVAPKMIIIKNLNASQGWCVYHESIGATKFLSLNSTDAQVTASDRFNDTSPTSSVFSVGSHADTNGNGNNMIAYCLAEKTGYSKFGSYTGNGNADGPFIYTGFKPAFVFQKRTDSTSNWHIFDNKREPENVMDKYLAPNDSGAEGTATGFDFLSNGFKSRTNSNWNNQSGGAYIYMAFAEEPLVANVGQSIPATAR